MTHDYPKIEDHFKPFMNRSDEKWRNSNYVYTDLLPWIIQRVGIEWCSKRKKKLESNGKILHPLYALIYKTAKIFKGLKQGDIWHPNKELLELVPLVVAMMNIEGSIGFEERLTRLKNTTDIDEFNSIAFEIEVANSYKFPETTIRFIEESQEDGVKTPDLYVSTPDGDFHVECKCKHMGTITSYDSVKDYVKRQMKVASKQLKGDLPGLLWCRLPQERDLLKARNHGSEIKTLVTSLMIDDQHRSINKVHILVPVLYTVNAEQPYFIKQTIRDIVEHPNPAVVTGVCK